MSVEMGPEDNCVSDDETVAAVDDIDGRPHLVVADRSQDDTWIAIPERAAVALDARE